jgi:hypothetical protein
MRCSWIVVLLACGRTALLEPATPFELPDDVDAGEHLDAGARDAGTPDAGHDAGFDAGFDAGVIAPMPWICETADSGAPSEEACERDVIAELYLPNDPNCFVDVVPAPGERGTLRWDCTSDAGNAEIIFARATFHGAFFAPTVTTCVGTSYLFADNCTWLSAQHISGSVEPGSALDFEYSEAPADGQMGCFPACTASGKIHVQ